MGEKCLICRPVICSVEGADHTGRDYFLRCRRCRTRTAHHVEGYTITPTVEELLRREWRAGRIETPRRAALSTPQENDREG